MLWVGQRIRNFMRSRISSSKAPDIAQMGLHLVLYNFRGYTRLVLYATCKVNLLLQISFSKSLGAIFLEAKPIGIMVKDNYCSLHSHSPYSRQHFIALEDAIIPINLQYPQWFKTVDSLKFTCADLCFSFTIGLWGGGRQDCLPRWSSLRIHLPIAHYSLVQFFPIKISA